MANKTAAMTKNQMGSQTGNVTSTANTADAATNKTGDMIETLLMNLLLNPNINKLASAVDISMSTTAITANPKVYVIYGIGFIPY
tara:strand:- start:199 stop:453 length:255 start_codon:yes stop_codon:yes gene_type:complete